MAPQRPGCATPSGSSDSKRRGKKFRLCLNKRASKGVSPRGLTPLLARLFLSSCSGQRSVLAGLSDGRLVHTTGVKPFGRQQDAFAQVYFRLVAEFAPRLLDAVPVVAAEHERAKLRHDGLCARQGRYHLLRDDTAVVDGQVGQVQRGPFAANSIGDGIEHLLLCQRAVV